MQQNIPCQVKGIREVQDIFLYLRCKRPNDLHSMIRLLNPKFKWAYMCVYICILSNIFTVGDSEGWRHTAGIHRG